jgi:hypothetical protein
MNLQAAGTQEAMMEEIISTHGSGWLLACLLANKLINIY